MSSGSLGQGLSAGVGMALGARLDGRDQVRVFVLLGDGELQEGQVWEAALAGAKYGLDNLVAIVDDNRVQLMGDTAAIMPVEPIPDKWRAFGWHVIEVDDGHDVEAIVAACEEAKTVKGRPSVIVAQTIKGKGVSFMENTHLWHSALVTEEQMKQALAELRSGRGDAPCLSSWPSATPSARLWSISARRTTASWSSTPTWPRRPRPTCSRTPTPSASSRWGSPSRT